MMPTDLLLQIFNTVRSHKGMPPLAKIETDMRLREDLNFTSLDLAELTVRIEEKFDVDVFADGLVFTVGEVQAKLAKSGKQKPER